MNQNALLKTIVHFSHSFKTFLVSSSNSIQLDFRTLHGIILLKSNLDKSQILNIVATLHILRLKTKALNQNQINCHKMLKHSQSKMETNSYFCFIYKIGLLSCHIEIGFPSFLKIRKSEPCKSPGHAQQQRHRCITASLPHTWARSTAINVKHGPN